jgi:death-on-curing protein
MRYLTIDELIYINEQIPSRERIHTIVDGKRKVRDMGLLEAAAARPAQTVFGQDAYPTPQEKGAALLHSLARNHPFADGNKRTATIALIFMLHVNGLRVTWDETEALAQIVAVAEGQASLADFAAWLPGTPIPVRLEPDAEADMQLIATIQHEHRWLLTELAER